MTARELILASLHSRPMTARQLVGLLVSHGYTETAARSMTDSWLSIMVERGQVAVRECDGVAVYVAIADYEQEKEPAEKKSANTVWRDAIAEHGRGR